MTGAIKRGAFILFEGCDRSGKSTQSRLLYEYLKAKQLSVQHMVCPQRQSNIGQVIDAYLKNKQELCDEVIHLLFTANRWEMKNEMKKLLESGITIVMDRYSYSGVAYSVAKGLSYDWCLSPEKQLLRPDVVFYLNVPIEKLMDRGEFGAERYETFDFQTNVAKTFERIYEQEKSYWQKLDASQSVEDLSKQINAKSIEILQEVQSKPLGYID